MNSNSNVKLDPLYMPLEVFTPKARKMIEHSIKLAKDGKLNTNVWSRLSIILGIKSTPSPPNEFEDFLNSTSSLYYKFTRLMANGEIFIPLSEVMQLDESIVNSTNVLPSQIEFEKMIAELLKSARDYIKTSRSEKNLTDFSISDIKILEDWLMDKKKAMRTHTIDDLDRIVGHELDPLKCVELSNELGNLYSKLSHFYEIKKINGYTLKGFQKDIAINLETIEKIHEFCNHQ